MSASAKTDHQLAGNVINLAGYGRARRPTFKSSHASIAKPKFAEADADYVERMKVNGVVFLFVAALVCAGVWLADGIAQMSHHVS
jgi:hypothetical protein